ncbi:hypothetical protein EDD86DRAFT_99567 [Gorgonomyces haynaldii]|nr:hypothetical protein EDD86DRAFT_99567 [Gorgonomyces haynaldii]
MIPIIRSLLKTLPTKRQALGIISKIEQPFPCLFILKPNQQLPDLQIPVLDPIIVLEQSGTWKERLQQAHQLGNCTVYRNQPLKRMSVIPSVIVKDGHYQNIPTLDLLLMLIRDLSPKKYVMLRPGLDTKQVNLSQTTIDDPDVQMMDAMITCGGGIGYFVPPDDHLVENLVQDRPFKHSQSTVFRKGQLYSYSSLDQVDISKLTELLESSFQRKLSQQYWNRIQEACDTIIICEDYHGAVIVTREMNQDGERTLCYLDKFAVNPKYQGNGAAEILWDCMVKAYPKLFWRSRSNNPVNKWCIV